MNLGLYNFFSLFSFIFLIISLLYWKKWDEPYVAITSALIATMLFFGLSYSSFATTKHYCELSNETFVCANKRIDTGGLWMLQFFFAFVGLAYSIALIVNTFRGVRR